MKKSNKANQSLVDVVISAENPESLFKGLDIPINLVNTSEKGIYYGQVSLSEAKYSQLTNYINEVEHFKLNQDFERDYSVGRKALIIEDIRKEAQESLPEYNVKDF